MSYARLPAKPLGDPDPPKSKATDWLVIAGLFGVAFAISKLWRNPMDDREPD